MTNISKNALKRLSKDLKELTVSPVPGVSVVSMDHDIFELHVNIIIPEGPYQSLMVHLVINIPQNYPFSSPAGRMADSFPFGSSEHEHIHGTDLCNDYLSNYESWFKAIDGGNIIAGSGWSSAMTLKGLMMVLKSFFSETDLPEPSENKIKDVFEKVSVYTCSDCGHATKKPYPQLPEITEEKSSTQDKSISSVISPAKVRAKNLLICSISKENYIDNSDLVLGYPLHLKLDKYKRLWTDLVPEMISYDQFMLEIQNCGIDKLDNYNSIDLRTATGKLYNNWLPVYINENHFQKNLQCIKNTISVIANGEIEGTNKNDFEPKMVLKVLPSLMNKMVVSLMNCESYESESLILAYCHYLRLLMRFLEEYPELRKNSDNIISKFMNSANDRHKNKSGDIGELLIKLSLSKKYNYKDVNCQRIFLTEYFARQVFWINKKDANICKETNNQIRLAKTFEYSEISNKLLVFNLKMAENFIFEGVEGNLDASFGIPPSNIVSSFQTLIKKIKTLNNYVDLMAAISFNKEINSANTMRNFLDRAIEVSLSQGYTKSRSNYKKPSNKTYNKKKRY